MFKQQVLGEMYKLEHGLLQLLEQLRGLSRLACNELQRDLVCEQRAEARLVLASRYRAPNLGRGRHLGCPGFDGDLVCRSCK